MLWKNLINKLISILVILKPFIKFNSLRSIYLFISNLITLMMYNFDFICGNSHMTIYSTNFFQRFLPSEFGNEVDVENTVEPAKSAFEIKAQIRRAIEAAGIPYTYIFCKLYAGYYLPTLAQPFAVAPPTEKVFILGDGNTTSNHPHIHQSSGIQTSSHNFLFLHNHCLQLNIKWIHA